MSYYTHLFGENRYCSSPLPLNMTRTESSVRVAWRIFNNSFASFNGIPVVPKI